MAGAVYDAGALIAAERGDRRFAQFHSRLLRVRSPPIVPLVVLAQVWRGGSQHLLSIALKGCVLLPEDERTTRRAGEVCAASGTTDVVDALVMVTAVSLGTSVVTSDPDDLGRLAAVLGTRVALLPV